MTAPVIKNFAQVTAKADLRDQLRPYRIKHHVCKIHETIKQGLKD